MASFSGLPSARASPLVGKFSDSVIGYESDDVNGDSVVVVGGYDENGPCCDIWLSPVDGLGNNPSKWQEFPCIGDSSGALARMDFASCFMVERCELCIYLLGGVKLEDESVSILNDLWCFSFTTRQWSLVIEECPLAERSNHSLVSFPFPSDTGVEDGAKVDGGFLVAYGGEQLGTIFGDTWVYLPHMNAWQQLSFISGQQQPLARFGHSATRIQSSVETSGQYQMALFGGCVREETEEGFVPIYLNDLWILNINLSSPTGCVSATTCTATWLPVQCHGIAPSPRDKSALCCGDDGSLFIFGGFGLLEVTGDDEGAAGEEEGEKEEEVDEDYLSDLWKFDPTNGEYVELDPPGTGAARGASLTLIMQQQKQQTGGSESSPELMQIEGGGSTLQSFLLVSGGYAEEAGFLPVLSDILAPEILSGLDSEEM